MNWTWDIFILTVLKLLAVLVLVLLNGFFVAAEFALVRIRETQLDALVAKGWKRAKMARHIVRNLNSYLSATQLGITMASLGLGFLGEPVFDTLLVPLLVQLRRVFGGLAAFDFLRLRFRRADLFDHCGGRTGAEMADDPKDAAGGAVGGAAVALVLHRVLSLQPVAELLGALAAAPHRH